jgi:hypothetical protein
MGDIILLQNMTRKRAYLKGEIDARERQLGLLWDDLETVDRMICLVNAGTDPNAIKGIRPHMTMPGFRQGELTRLIFSVLRQANAPLLVHEIAERVAARKDVEISSDLRTRVRGCVGRLTREGRLQKIGKPRTVRWTLPK